MIAARKGLRNGRISHPFGKMQVFRQSAGGTVCAPPLTGRTRKCPQVKQMYRNDPTSRPDRVLLTALAVVLATASAVFGAALTYRPETRVIVAAEAPQLPTVQEMMLREHRCLSEALYYEARGEGVRGEKAVAEVVFHRMIAGNYGASICAVVYEGSDRKVCQFSFTCNGDLNRPREASAWNEAEQLAAQILTGEVRLSNSTGGAISYHAVWVKPYWAPTLKRTAQIGKHIFYRGHIRES
jgi:spore germination cell wall hydrolase CwlJ-like protein